MELESQLISPPNSPIIGYSGSQDEQSMIDSGVIYCLNCKGVPKRNDHSFSPEGYILRRELSCALENLRNSPHSLEGSVPRLIRCFNGNLFDPLDKAQLRLMVAICRKAVTSLEILSESSNSYHVPVNYDMNDAAMASDDPDEPCNQNPWVLRKRVCQFLNFIVRQLKYYRGTWRSEDWEGIFVGLKKSLGTTKEWSPVLKGHCGYRGGNECSSATYHFFHLQLELRWNLLLIFGLRDTVIQWVLDDLINLSWFSYSNELSVALDEKQPFNCACLKEIWVMIRLLLDELQPMEKTFWTFYGEAMQRLSNSDVFFPIWLTANLADTGSYTVAGLYTPSQEKEDGTTKESSGYKFLHGAFKEWVNRGGKSAEILKLSLEVFKYWGGDCEIIFSLWMQYVPRLDKGNDVSNFQSYSSIENWLNLVHKICDNKDDATQQRRNVPNESYLGSNNDPFFHFIRLVGGYASSCSEKDFRRLKSNICMKLSRANTNDFGELGIIRVSTLFLVLINVVTSHREAVSLCERLQDTFTYGKGKNTPGRRKSILRAYSLMIMLLLQKRININSNLTVAPAYMKIVNELLVESSSSSKSPGEPSKKDLIMIYIDFLDNLPKYSPILSQDQNLGRSAMISANFLMWLSKCGANYVVRTARVLSNITNWVLSWIRQQTDFTCGINTASLTKSPSEAKDLLMRINEKCLPYMKSLVVQNSNRIPVTDMKPISELAGDVTILIMKLYESSGKPRDEIFDSFATCERTCPVVSQFYVERLFKHKDIIENSFTAVKWAQVWIRLIALDCPIPDELSELILGTNFASTSNSDLLRHFCTKSWSKEDCQQILGQLTSLLKGVMTGTYFKEQDLSESEKVINSVITTCVTLLKNIRFDLLYIRGLDISIAHQFLNIVVPPSWPGMPPWEKWASPVLKSVEENLYDVFQAVISHVGYAQDNFLTRKLQDVVCLAVFGFIRDPIEVDKDTHPACQILNFSEDNEITLVKSEILPKVIAGETVVKNEKFYKLFLRAVHMMRVKKFPTIVLRLGTGIIRTFLMYPSMEKSTLGQCLNSICYCMMFGSSPFYRQLAVDAFENAFKLEFAFRSRRCFALCKAIGKLCNSEDKTKNEKVKSFLKNELIPILVRNVELVEQKRGIGTDSSLREPLESLQAEIER